MMHRQMSHDFSKGTAQGSEATARKAPSVTAEPELTAEVQKLPELQKSSFLSFSHTLQGLIQL